MISAVIYCRFVEFDTSVICHVFMHCFGSFLLQAMFLNLQVFAFKGQNMKLTVRMLFTCILRCYATSTKLTTFPATGVVALASLFKIIRKIMSIPHLFRTTRNIAKIDGTHHS